jgi:hypothetical protein
MAMSRKSQSHLSTQQLLTTLQIDLDALLLAKPNLKKYLFSDFSWCFSGVWPGFQGHAPKKHPRFFFWFQWICSRCVTQFETQPETHPKCCFSIPAQPRPAAERRAHEQLSLTVLAGTGAHHLRRLRNGVITNQRVFHNIWKLIFNFYSIQLLFNYNFWIIIIVEWSTIIISRYLQI